MSTIKVPEENYYTKDHEWAHVDENVVTIGITDYAQDALGEIVYVELPEVGQRITQTTHFGAVESIKAASDLIAPISGTVIEVNEDLLDDPSTINDDPFNEGWLVRVEMESEKELVDLLQSKDYIKWVKESKKT